MPSLCPLPSLLLALSAVILLSIPGLNLCETFLLGTKTGLFIPQSLAFCLQSAHPLSVICTCRRVYFFSQEVYAEKDILLITN